MPQAATPNGGAEGSSRTQQQSTTGQFAGNGGGESASVTDRLRTSLFASDDSQPDKGQAPQKKQAQADAGGDDDGDPDRKASPQGDDQQQADPQNQADDQQQQDASGTDEGTDDAGAQDDEQPDAIRSLNELAEGLGWDFDKILDLEASTKINGKDGKVRLRDLVKSHQLEGHLNQGLMRLSEDRKAFEAETGRKVSEIQARVQQVSQVVTLAQKILDGEFADVNWQDLQRTDPAAYQAKYGAYQMRFNAIQQLNQTVQQELSQQQAQQQAALKAYRDEQGKLLESKFPEWSDAAKRKNDVTEFVAIGSDAYGLNEQEILSVVDHRMLLVLRDAVRWQKLQKSKPATLKKVRNAPKLIRPGSQQSRAAQDGLDEQKGRETLRRTGRVQDAVPLLKKRLFN